jgi:hypothetical protein
MISFSGLIREAVEKALADKRAEMTEDLLDRIVEEVALKLAPYLSVP